MFIFLLHLHRAILVLHSTLLVLNLFLIITEKKKEEKNNIHSKFIAYEMKQYQFIMNRNYLHKFSVFG